MQIKATPSHHWGRLAVALSVLGAAVFYLWQPVSDYFLTGNFEPNLSVHVETETFPVGAKESLLVVHVKASNRGNVPVELLGSKDKGELGLEIRRLEAMPTGAWVEPANLPLVASQNVLAKHRGTYVLEPNAMFDEVESISLPHGLYWIKATLVYPDGDYIDHVAVVSLENPDLPDQNKSSKACQGGKCSK